MFILNGQDILVISKCIQGKKLIIYGTGICAVELIRKLACLDIEVAYCVDDEIPETTGAVEVRDVYSLLLEKEPIYVLIAKKNRKKCTETLKGLGLKFYQDFNNASNAWLIHSAENDSPLDASLGYTMPCNSRETGVRVYGEIDTAEKVIAILGGSTSDPYYHPWKSWGEFLWEKSQNKWAIVVGAVIGYTSCDEVVKLLRDILPYHPDAIISYSGVNDPNQIYPYVNRYQLELYGILNKLKPKDIYKISEAHGVLCHGVRNKACPAEDWINNQRIMHAIANEYGIIHKAYFQPTLYTKKRGALDEEIYIHSEQWRDMPVSVDYTNDVLNKREELQLDYIKDATEWFNEKDGIFVDYSHVTEDGNRMIAERIYQDIKIEWGWN